MRSTDPTRAVRGSRIRQARSRWLVAVLLAAAITALSVDLAMACSCAIGGNARENLQQADAAFVGVVTARRALPARETGFGLETPIELDFQVERAFKGPLGDQVTVHTITGPASCGFDARPGTRLGLYLRRTSTGAFAADGCSIVDPAELAKGAAPLPRPSGRGPVRFLLSGGFGAPVVIALDRRGDTLAYGSGSGSINDMHVCPGGRRSLELTAIAGGGHQVYARDLRNMRVRYRVNLPGEPLAVSCRAPDADRIVALVSRVAPGGDWSSELLEISEGGTRRLHRGSAREASIGERHAWLGGDSAGGLTRVELRTGRAQRVARLDTFRDFAASPDGRRAAFEAADGRLCVAAGPAAISVRTGAWGILAWVDDRTIVVRNFESGARTVRVLDARLRAVRALRGLDDVSVAAGAAGRVYAIAGDRLLMARARSGPVQRLGRVPFGGSQLAVVGGGTRVSGRARAALP